MTTSQKFEYAISDGPGTLIDQGYVYVTELGALFATLGSATIVVAEAK